MSWNCFVTQLHDWQELAGAFLGPFLAVVLSGIAFLIGRGIEKRRQEKEAMRRTEVAITYSLNSVATMQKKLQYFVRVVRQLIEEIRTEVNPRSFALQTVNFPAIGTIYLDEEIIKLPTKSYYLHNKLLWIHSGVRDVNNVLESLREDFARVLRLNEKMLDLMRDNPNPPAQRQSYIENLTLFANEIERFSNNDLMKGVTPMVQVKIYNEKLRKPRLRGTRTRWETEGADSWTLQTILRFKKPQRDLSNIDRMDKTLQPEVDTALAEMETRRQQLDQEGS